MTAVVSLCHYCHEQEAYLACTCSSTQLKLCFPCYQQHHQTPVQASCESTQCHLCKSAPAESICKCEYPPLHLCKTCADTHLLSSGSIWRHDLEAIAGTPGKNLQDRQYVINMVYKNLQEDLSLVQRAVYEVNGAAETALHRIEDWRKSTLKRLTEVQERVGTQISLLRAQIEGKRLDKDYETVTKLDQVIREGEKYMLAGALKELSMFRYHFESEALEKLLDGLFTFQEDFSLASLHRFSPPQTRVQVLHVVTGTNAIMRYELPAGYMRVLRISRVSRFLPGSGWCFASSGALVFAGGEKSGDMLKQAVVVNPVSKTAARLRDMQVARGYHGQLFYNGQVYVFGGTRNIGFWTGKPEGLTACEKYCPDTCEWRNLADLIEARDVVSAVIWNEKMYVAGSGSIRVEMYDPEKDEMTLLPQLIPGAKMHRVLLLPYEDAVLILKENRLYQVKLGGKDEGVAELQQYDQEVLDKECPPPVQLFDTFFLQTKTACFLLNAGTYQLQEAFKFPNI